MTADDTAAGSPSGAAEAGGLDMLLTQAALGPRRQFFPGRPALRFARALAGQPGLVAARAGGLAAELARIAGGTSGVTPAARDRRFADPAWTGNPVLRRVMQGYLAAGDATLGLVRETPLDRRDAERVRFAVGNLVDALAPSNSPLLSPEAWKAAADSGGASLVSGARHLLSDLSSPPRVPTMVPPDAYTVGSDLAATPGAVVLRRVRQQGLPGRPQARRGLRLAAPRRPDLELLGQQLPARPRARPVRHPVLERGHDADDRRAAPRLRPRAPVQLPHEPRRAHRARHRDRPGPGRPDSYVVAGVADHICPWQSCYRSSRLPGGKTRFVLSSSGHIAALVNPADSKKSRYQASDDVTADAESWQRAAAAEQGSWWPDYASWLAARSGGRVPAPEAVGSDRFRVIGPAPGSYVRAA
jgi:hypothetical protein